MRARPGRLLALLAGLLAACGAGGTNGEPGATGASGAAVDRAVSAGRGASTARAAAAPAVASLPHGRLVWESNRSGAWRLWTLRLPDGTPEQLTADEPHARHCCAHLSPDGARLVYLSLPDSAGEYPLPTETGELRLLDLGTGEEEVLSPAARTYLEHRAAIWHGPDALAFIDAEGYTVSRDLATGKQRRLTRRPRSEYGWLIDSTLHWATAGRPTFSPYDAGTRTVTEEPRLAGCQPYFSADGRWGFWTAGAGGPLSRIDLATRTTGTIVAKDDSRLPDGLDYLYFPMLSADGRLFAFGASAGEHDHHSADYEILVAESDPETLELVAPPVRVTRDPGVDRFPDVWAEPLPLGSHRGEAPLTVRLRAPRPGEWRWSLGDGATAEGNEVEHTWTHAGRFPIAARVGGMTEFAGEVVVAPSRPPAAVGVSLPEGGARIEVTFDEPVAARPEASVELGSRTTIEDWSIEPGGRRLVVRPSAPVRRPDRLLLSGFEDRADRPNALPETALEIEPPLWPADREALQLLWQTGDAPNLVHDPEEGVDRTIRLEPANRAHLDHFFRMVTGGGFFSTGEEEGNRLRWALQATNELTLELTLRPAVPSQTGRVVSFAGRGGENFSLWQRGEVFGWTLRVGSPRGEHPDASIEIGRLPADRPSHLVLTHAPSSTRVWVDGELRLESREVRGDFFQFRTLPLTVGSRAGGGGDWAGTVEGLAVWNRVLADEEIREDHLRYRMLTERRRVIAVREAEAEVVAVSETPTAQSITPYTRALRTVDYRVERWISGEPEGERIRVVEWALLDGRPLPAPAPGDRERLRLERFADNPQLEGLYLSDTLGNTQPGPLLYAPGSASR
ncbi:MAG: LamG-like jellyroll fold domain-containing protein [Thermoanaerobaculia bacterium]